MSRTKIPLLVLALLAGLAAQASAGSTGIVVVVNTANSLSSMNKAQLNALYKAKTTEFPNGQSAAVVNLPPENSLRQDFDRAVLNMSPDEAKRFWIDMKIRSGAAAPPKMPTPSAVARYVAKAPNGIGYLPESDAKGLKIVARINGNNVTGP